MEEWSDKWLLKFHPDKCVVMTVGQRKVNTEYSMSSGSGRCQLKMTEAEKDIGVTVDPKLKFDMHDNNVVNKANKIIPISG